MKLILEADVDNSADAKAAIAEALANEKEATRLINSALNAAKVACERNLIRLNNVGDKLSLLSDKVSAGMSQSAVDRVVDEADKLSDSVTDVLAQVEKELNGAIRKLL